MKLVPSKQNCVFLLSLMLVLASAACGGGGGGSDSDNGAGNGNTGGGGQTEVWKVEAGVTSDGCRERIADVTQTFTVKRNDGLVSVRDTLLDLNGVETPDGFTATAAANSISCSRQYEATFSGMTDTTALVALSVKSTCGSFTCENKWSGVGTLASASASKEDEELNPKVTGYNCVPPIPAIGYRPSLFECFGNSAVLARDNIRDAYSIVVRRIGQFNDRDPNNPSCGTAECSPYKTQQRIDLPEYRVNCLGASGFSNAFNEVTRISVKFTAALEDKSDPRQFQQYCLQNKKADLN